MRARLRFGVGVSAIHDQSGGEGGGLQSMRVDHMLGSWIEIGLQAMKRIHEGRT